MNREYILSDFELGDSQNGDLRRMKSVFFPSLKGGTGMKWLIFLVGPSNAKTHSSFAKDGVCFQGKVTEDFFQNSSIAG